jgi:putative DNA methylase
MKKATATLTPLALKDAPALIETVFPAQKVSFEAQRERKAGAGQTLTALGSYWKGRKPLILVRAILLGCLLPPTDDAKADLDIFEKLMAFDVEGLARRAAIGNTMSPNEIAARMELDKPWDYFKATIKRGDITSESVRWISFPLDADAEGISLRWQSSLSDDDKLVIYRELLTTYNSYEEKAGLGKRPEELDQDWLYAPVWPAVNLHYAHLGINAKNLPELVEQLGILRYGHRPRVGDTFCGSGSIPFEAARIGCDAYASDLNPIACMLTWGAFNVIGASPERRAEIEDTQHTVAAAVDKEITALGIEHDESGNRAKAYLYCLETRCPETGWMVPLLPTMTLSVKYRTVVQLVPDYSTKSFQFRVIRDASNNDIKASSKGTVTGGDMAYDLDGKSYRTSIKTLRGDYRKEDGTTGNRLRLWEKGDFRPRSDDIFQERLYAIQWISKETLEAGRQDTWFSAPTEADLGREKRVEQFITENLCRWQDEGVLPDMAIESGYNTDQPIRERGWTHWHHLFNARALLLQALKAGADGGCVQYQRLARDADRLSRLCRFNFNPQPSQGPKIEQVFSDQALNPLFNYGTYSSIGLEEYAGKLKSSIGVGLQPVISNVSASKIGDEANSDIFITDPPYADAVNYHEITEFFIAWLRKNPPKPFDDWVWDSRRALAVKGSGEDFRYAMVAAYKAMAERMPDNGTQCVMFTHQDTGVWGDLIGIFWAAGLQVFAAWYVATETTSAQKKGGYVQGTVILMLKKRAAGERTGFKQRLLPAVRQEVARQIETMMHLNDTVESSHGEPVWGDSDLQMAGYAAALKVLTAYTRIGDEDVTTFALRPRTKGEVTVVDEIVQQAAETASSLLVPEGLTADTWGRLTGIERFVLRMMDMETAGVAKLDNYQNFAKAFRVMDYTRVMGDMRPNNARLKRVSEYASRDLTDGTEIGATRLGQLIIGLQQLLKDTEAQVIVEQLREEMADFLEARTQLVDMLTFIERKTPEIEVRSAAEVLGARLKNLRFGD